MADEDEAEAEFQAICPMAAPARHNLSSVNYNTYI
jgi:hypothetical protein